MAAPRRRRRWADTLLNDTCVSGSNDRLDLTEEFSPNEKAGLTLVRMILCYTIRPSNPTTVSGNQLVDLGIGVAETEAFAADILPDTNAEADYPRGGWLYRCRHNVQDEPTAQGVITWPEHTRDIRAQRRIGGPDATLFYYLYNTVGEGTSFTVITVGIIRCLFLLP